MNYNRKKIFALVNNVNCFAKSLEKEISSFEEALIKSAKKSSKKKSTTPSVSKSVESKPVTTPLSDEDKKVVNQSPNLTELLSTQKTTVSYSSPIKTTWANSGNWYTDSKPELDHPGGHKGLDLRVPRGTAVYPAANGVVCEVASGTPKGGNTVNVAHIDGKTTYYAHLDTISVSLDQKVDTNTVIGTVGNTGNAIKKYPHLHFGIRDFYLRNSWEDPAKYIPNIPPYTDISEQEKLEPGMTIEKET